MRASFLLTAFAVAAVAACGGKPAPEEPAPEPVQTEPAPAPAPTQPAPAPRDDSAERMAREAAERAAALTRDLSQVINFDYDAATVRNEDQAILDRKAAILQANTGVRLRISGHADERGSDEYNLALGNRRAAAAKRYLVSKGIDEGRLEVVSFGEERPAAQGTDETSLAQNRRDEFEVTSGGGSLVAPR